jgi:tetratricopeptide (TPR) repeat protein
MRFSIFLVFIIVGLSVQSQVWSDTLIKAQDFYKNKEFDKSNALYSKAKVSSNQELSYQKERGQSAYRSEDFDSANEAYALALSNENNVIDQSDILFNQGNTYLKKGDYEMAIDKYKASILKNPSNQKAKYNLSQALRQKSSQTSSQKEQQDQSEQDQSKSQSENNLNTKDFKSNKKEEYTLEKQVSNRVLDELLKRAQETKRKLANQKTKSSKNNKDW